MPVGFRRERRKTARVSSGRPVENPSQMDLVGKAGFQRDRGQRLAGTWHQNLAPLYPPAHEVALVSTATACLNGRLK